MKINRILLIVAVLVPGLAQAQTSVSIYGLIDVGARFASGLALSTTSSPAANPGSTNSLASGVDRSGRFGIVGSEDLGNGYKAVFRLETELYGNTGSVDPNLGTAKDTSASSTNKFFERQAYAGLSTSFGEILLGRQQSVLRDIIDNIDAIDGRFSSFNPNLQYTSLNSSGLVSSAATFYGTGNPGNDSMMRQDNALKYVAQSGPVIGTLLYSFGGASGATAAASSTEAGLTYQRDGIVLSGAYQDMHNNIDTLKLTAYTVGGRYTLGDWQFAGNFGSNTVDRAATIQIKTDIYSLGTTYAATPKLGLTLGYYNVKRTWTDNAKPKAKIDRVIGFTEYKLSKRSLVFLELDRNKWGGDATQFQGSAANKSIANGLTLGIDHTF